MNSPVTIETVRGRAPAGLADDVVCVARDAGGEIVATSAVSPARVDVVGGRRFWLLRLSAPGVARDELTRATFAALDEAFEPGGPIGLCVLPTAAEAAERPEAVWKDPRLIHAGLTGDGRQVRIGYFEGASIVAGVPLRPVPAPLPAGSGRILVFGDQRDIGRQDVVAFWEREGALTGEDARRRAEQLHLVAVEDGRIVATTTAFVEHHPQLGLPMWGWRLFIAEHARRTSIAARISTAGSEDLEDRYTSGRDTRASGIVYEIENDILKGVGQPRWMPYDFTFVGETPHGAHIRVRYFPGARAPTP